LLAFRASFEFEVIAQCDGIVVVVVSEHDGDEEERSYVSWREGGVDGMEDWGLWTIY
jgi:hypothetical protein